MLVDHPTSPVASAHETVSLPKDTASTTPLTYIGGIVNKAFSKVDERLALSLTLKVLAFTLVLSWYALLPVHFISVSDPDLGWHLRSGEWIAEHHQLPRTDPFSITGAGKPWVAYSWPFSLLIYEIAKNFDLLGVAAFTLFGWMAAVSAMFMLVRGQGAGFWRSVGLTFLGGAIVELLASPRPGAVTIVFFLLLFHLMLQERKKGYTHKVWIVPVIIWLWANVHVQFVYGLFVIALFSIEPVLDWFFLGKERARKFSPELWGVLAVSSLLTFANPYGFGPYKVILDFIHQPLLARFVLETRAMSFTANSHFVVLALCLAAAFILGRRKTVKPLWVILLLWAATSAFRMERDIWLAATVALAIIAERPTDAPAEDRHPHQLWLYGTVGVVLVIFAMLERVPTNKNLLGLIANEMPVGAVAYVHEHHLSGPIFNDYDWGGFLIYALPEFPVAIDGRTNIHGQDEVGRSMNTWSLRPGWEQDPLLNRANLVIGSPSKPLTIHLLTDPHFKVAFQDRTCVLFQRVENVPTGGKPAPPQQSNQTSRSE